MPPLAKLKVGKLILVVVKFNVKLRKAVKLLKLVGSVAPVFTFVKLTSWILSSVVPEAKVRLPFRLFA